MRRRDIPNVISGLRIVAVIPLCVLLYLQAYGAALTVFLLAGLSDGVDGYLARRYHWVSRLGSILDPIGDKVLLIASYVMLGWFALVPVWLVVLVLARDVVIVAGAVAYHFVVGRYDMQPHLLSKVNTAVQVGLVLLVMASQSILAVAPWVLGSMIYLTAATTVSSGVEYVWVWGRRACRYRCGGSHD